MGFSLIPREMKFFAPFNDTTALLSASAAKFVEMVIKPDDLAKRGKEIKYGDLLLKRSIEALDRSFITPFDRGDIRALVVSEIAIKEK